MPNIVLYHVPENGLVLSAVVAEATLNIGEGGYRRKGFVIQV